MCSSLCSFGLRVYGSVGICNLLNDSSAAEQGTLMLEAIVTSCSVLVTQLLFHQSESVTRYQTETIMTLISTRERSCCVQM